MQRRDFLTIASAASFAGMTAAPDGWGQSGAATEPWRYKHRVQFGAWINDMRNISLPRENWPCKILDDVTEQSIIHCLELGKQAGFNQFDVFGLFASDSYPVDIRAAFADQDRKIRVNRILQAARDLGIKNIFGLGVYSWGFDEIIKKDPAVRGPNRRAMCGSAPESFRWQTKLIDVILDEIDVDGFHLESADLGRCTCERCAPIHNVAYHCQLNAQTADYIRSKAPDKIVSSIMLGWGNWGQDFTDEEKGYLVDLSRHIDILWDQGHFQTYIPHSKRRQFIQSLHCDYGTSGGFWNYHCLRWDRMRWFLPYVDRTGQHIKTLYQQGGRGVMFYQGPTINPSVEVNIACGGRLLLDSNRAVSEVLDEVVETLYRPRDASSGRQLVELFLNTEKAYFDQWSTERITTRRKIPPPGELLTGPLRGTSPGPPLYLKEPYLDDVGRQMFKDALLAGYDTLLQIGSRFDDAPRIERMKKSIMGSVTDLETLASAAG